MERYATLAQRAETRSFGLIEDDVIVLDTETTGLSHRDSELIAIAAARLRGREIVDRFDTFVKPSGLIPEEITKLTSITNADVAHAPSAVDAVASLAEFVGGCPVVAHNAAFDRGFIEQVPGGADVSDIWIDSLALGVRWRVSRGCAQRGIRPRVHRAGSRWSRCFRYLDRLARALPHRAAASGVA